MKDDKIMDKLLSRDESALSDIRSTYGKYLFRTASNILSDETECEECLDDALIEAWKRIPPQRPDNLGGWLSVIVRNRALEKLKMAGRDKRMANSMTVSLSEIGDVIADEQDIDADRLYGIIEKFLSGVSTEQRKAFVGKYYFFEPSAKIALKLGTSEKRVNFILFRLRKKLKKILEEEKRSL